MPVSSTRRSVCSGRSSSARPSWRLSTRFSGASPPLHFQAIFDLVGDKLREVFKTPDLGIRWYDEKTNLSHYLYSYEHGERLAVLPRQPMPGGLFETVRKTRQPIVLNTAADYAKVRTGPLPGTDSSKSMIYVPITIDCSKCLRHIESDVCVGCPTGNVSS